MDKAQTIYNKQLQTNDRLWRELALTAVRAISLLLLFFVCNLSNSSFFIAPAIAMEYSEAVRIFRASVEAYKEGQIEESVKLGESLVAGGFTSPAVFFNLGNAYLKSGRLGRAVLNYCRAERLAPRDADLRVNLELARGQVEGTSGGSQSAAVPYLFRLRHLTTYEIRWLSLIFFIAATGFFLLGLYLGIRKRRLVGWTILLALVWVYFLTAWIVRTVGESGLAVVVTSVEARFEPLKGATTYFRLPEGIEVHVLREQDGWYKIERADGKAGWVPSEAVVKI